MNSKMLFCNDDRQIRKTSSKVAVYEKLNQRKKEKAGRDGNGYTRLLVGREIPKERVRAVRYWQGVCIWKPWRKGCTYVHAEGGAWANLTLVLRLIQRIRLPGAGGVLPPPYGQREG